MGHDVDVGADGIPGLRDVASGTTGVEVAGIE
jgi:hypothetical protein